MSERLFNVLNNETYHSQAQADGNKFQNQLMARATGYLKAMQMNDISEMLYYN